MIKGEVYRRRQLHFPGRGLTVKMGHGFGHIGSDNGAACGGTWIHCSVLEWASGRMYAAPCRAKGPIYHRSAPGDPESLEAGNVKRIPSDGNFSPGKRLPNEQQRRSGPPTPRSQCPNRSGSAFPLTSARHQTGLCNAPHGRGSKHGNNEKKHKEERQRFALFEDSGRQLTPPMPRTISLLVIRRDVVVALDSKTQTFATLPAAICEGRQILPPPPRPRTQPIGLRYRYKNTIMAIHGQRIPRHSQPCTVSVSFSTTARTNPGKEESCNGLETRSGPSPIAFSPCFPPFSLWRAALARRKLGGQPVICAGTATHSSGSNRASRRPLVFRLRFAVLSSLSLSLSLSLPRRAMGVFVARTVVHGAPHPCLGRPPGAIM
ncbi:hypothetical protein CSUB01_07016 [Colletotrichum sublineola]|uniref:Uncharacterized protein n=1 Tax=Colletotrichum sublineola TaxID=1173701 RepID=A0A066WX53_COLSU|nr:hypothetical protein CSUB01_07016 [Colletotrichum sublineola]